jgi:hypothetical protein
MGAVSGIQAGILSSPDPAAKLTDTEASTWNIGVHYGVHNWKTGLKMH